jgi:hypothetical protein
MPVIGGVIILLQLTVLFHAMKTGRPYYWIFIIMAFPILGCVIYFIVEMLPGSRQERRLKMIGQDIVKAINPDRDLKRRAEELEICGSVENKLKMADECVERGMFDEAIRLYEGARSGQYEFAPDLLHGLARARFFNGDPAVARELLVELRDRTPRYYAQEVALLSARAAARTGDRTTAIREIETLLENFVGLEARYRYAELLYQDGQAARARAELERLIEHARKFRVSQEERAWAKLARQGLTSLNATAA